MKERELSQKYLGHSLVTLATDYYTLGLNELDQLYLFAGWECVYYSSSSGSSRSR